MKRELKGGRSAAPAVVEESRDLADRIPHGLRAIIPPGVRRGVRKALGRER